MLRMPYSACPLAGRGLGAGTRGQQRRRDARGGGFVFWRDGSLFSPANGFPAHHRCQAGLLDPIRKLPSINHELAPPL